MTWAIVLAEPMNPPVPPALSTLADLLHELALGAPDRVALREGETDTTFGGLWSRAGEVSAALRAGGVKPGEVVAVAMPRSARLVIACVAVMRAGGVVLALDLRHPGPRNRRFLDAAGVRHVLVDGPVAPECAGHLTSLDVNLKGPPDDEAEPRVRGEDPAFLVFTSGSSGDPKGVLLSHAAMAERARAEQATFEFTPQDRYLLRTSPMLIGLPVALEVLALGVPMVVAPDAIADDAQSLAGLIHAGRLTFAGLPPRLIESLLSVPEISKKLASLRVLRSSGEALRPRLAAAFRALVPTCRVVDGYGTTEAGGIVLVADASDPVDLQARALAGRPLPGVQIRLVGDDGATATEGEIQAATPMLASGYLGGEASEKSGFMLEPGLDDRPPTRWYRTGDRGRLNPDGRFVVLGRLDVQLNVDGVRVDPAEVENALRAHPAVREAAVRTHPDATGRDRLIAYLVDQGGPAPSSDLRAFLARSMPPSLIPVRFVHLPALPLLPSGKVDRGNLPRPESLEKPLARSAANPGESRILPLFREVLGVPGLGVTDDFFEWGGDSVRAFDLMARIAALTGVRLPAAVILTASTVSALAEEIARGEIGEVSGVWLRQSGDLPPLVCLPGLAGDPLWFFPLLEALEPGRPVLGLSFVGLKPPISILRASSRAVEALRAVQPRGPYLLLGHSVGGVLAFEMAQELVRAGEGVSFLGLIDTYVPGQRRLRPGTRVGRAWQRVKRVRNRMILAARGGLARWGLGTGVRMPRFVPGLREAALRHRVSPTRLGVTLFRANEKILSSDLAADWAPLARGGMTVIDIPGHHFDLITGGRARELSARIAEAVARPSTSSSRGSSARSE